MSYDLYAFKRHPGRPDEDVLAEGPLSEAGEPSEDTPEWKAWRERVAAAIRQIDPRLVPFSLDHEKIAQLQGIGVDEARQQFRYIELDPQDEDSSPMLQWTVHDTYVAFTMPYPQGSAEPALDLVWRTLDMLARDFGLSVHDPQLDRVLDLTKDRPVCRQLIERVSGRLDAMAGQHTERRPWWKFW